MVLGQLYIVKEWTGPYLMPYVRAAKVGDGNGDACNSVNT